MGSAKMPIHKLGHNLQISRLIASLESAPIGDGDLLGSQFRCLPYQRHFLAGAFKPGVLRGGGKSGLASALCLDAIRPARSTPPDGL